ncbi:MAG TPA: ABC transporter ATP-binding protein, partial [Chloroflexota bacterium]
LVIMDHGRILAEGSPAELVERHAGREVLELRAGDVERRRVRETLAHDGSTATAIDVQDGLFIFCPDAAAIRGQLGLERQYTVRPATLEDVFLRLTGGKLEEGADG